MDQFVRCRHAVTEAEVEFPAGAVESMAPLGWAPVTGPRTYGEAEDGDRRPIEPAEPDPPAPAPAVTAPAEEEPTKPGRRVGPVVKDKEH